MSSFSATRWHKFKSTDITRYSEPLDTCPLAALSSLPIPLRSVIFRCFKDLWLLYRIFSSFVVRKSASSSRVSMAKNVDLQYVFTISQLRFSCHDSCHRYGITNDWLRRQYVILLAYKKTPLCSDSSKNLGLMISLGLIDFAHLLYIVRNVKKRIAVCRQACHHRYGSSHTIWDHTVLPTTRQRWHSRLYPSRSWYSI